MATEETKCEICGCECKPTLHHLVPQQVSRHKNKYLKTDEGNFLRICGECHSQIHALYSNQELKDRLFTKELLLADPKFHKYVEWKKKHPDFRGSSKMAKERRPKR